MKQTVKHITILILSALMLLSFPAQAADHGSKWVSAWSTTPVSASLNDLCVLDKLGVTLTAVSSRVSVTPTASGKSVRLVFSNEYGVTPLTVSSCTVAKTGKNPRSVLVSTIKQVRFSGKSYAVIAPGKTVTSDPVDFSVRTGEKMTVTTYFRGINTQRTVGLIGGDTFAAVGNYTHLGCMALGLPLSLTADSGDYQVIPALVDIDVLSDDPDACTCVIFGDSTVANEIPRLLESRLIAGGIENISVTQQAVKGNRLIADGVGIAGNLLGQAGTDRFERDVLSQSGIKYVIVKLGVNDIVHPYCKSKADKLTPVTFDEMTEGYTRLVKMAHDAGIEIYFTELSPWKGYTRNILGTGDDVTWSEEIDSIRLKLNEWFSGDSCPADGYIAFPSLHDPNDTYALVPEYTTDGAHLTPAGQKAFADAFPIEIFN